MAAPRSEDEASPQVERLWPARLRWRMRGAWQWPTFIALTVVDALLLQLLPPYESGPGGFVPALLLAGFANLILVAAVAPLIGRRIVRARRPDLPRAIADDYAGTAFMCVLCVLLLIAGVAHRPARAADARDRAAVFGALHDFVLTSAPAYAPALRRADALQLDKDLYRACVPTRDPRREVCIFVDTSRRPVRSRPDTEQTPNSDFRRFP